MNIVIINQTVRAMCAEVMAQKNTVREWKFLTEEELLYEVAVCIFGSQMVYEHAVAIADRLRELSLLYPPEYNFDRDRYKSEVVTALSAPLSMSTSTGSVRWVRPRFKNRLATLLTTSMADIYGCGHSIRQILLLSNSALEARETLIQYVCGFGPKQCSLYLRRIGFCTDFAVLDVHVMDYLRLIRGIEFPPSKLSRLSFYAQIEDEFRVIAIDFGYSLGCVDLAIWLTMRVVKREEYSWAL